MYSKEKDLGPTLIIGKYKASKYKNSSFGVYKVNSNKLITHKDTWKGATKIAKMLDEAYREGYADGSY